MEASEVMDGLQSSVINPNMEAPEVMGGLQSSVIKKRKCSFQ
jgi:hypothetical protein